MSKTSGVSWSDGDLRFGLEAVEHAENHPDEGFHPQGVDDEFALDLLEALVRRGWASIASPLRRADGLLVAAHGTRLNSLGRQELAAWRQADQAPYEKMPRSPGEAWEKLRALAVTFSPLARAIDAAEADLRQRGMYQSGPSIVKAMEVAYDHGFTWATDERTFVESERQATTEGVQEVHPTAPDPSKVFVVHGRDLEAKDALFNYLRALGLEPLEWETVVALTGSGTPYLGDIVERGFEEAAAAVVLFTPDDEVRLHSDLHGEKEPAFETQLTSQPRPNVLLEAGMALMRHRTRTIIVQVGDIRPVSDLGGRNVIHLGKSGALRALAERLRTAGCPVDMECEEISKDDGFAALSAQQRRAAPGDPSSRPDSTSWVLDVTHDDFELTYDQVNPDSRRPETARLLITYNGRLSCDQVVVEELRDARWSTVVVSIERHEAHTNNGYTTDVLRHLQPGETRAFTVNVSPEGQAGEIRLRLTPTINGRENPPVVTACHVKPPVIPSIRWGA